jgi:periplasmic protein TonB
MTSSLHPPASPRPRARWVLVLLPLVAVLGAACVAAEIEPPEPLYGEAPIPYPEALWDEGVEGTAYLRIRVTDTGAVDSVEVEESSGHERLDQAAMDGARELRFQPGRRNGKRVRMWATIPIEFSTRPRTSQDPRP